MIQDGKIIVMLDIEQAAAVVEGLKLFQRRVGLKKDYDSKLDYNPTLELAEGIKRSIQDDIEKLNHGG